MGRALIIATLVTLTAMACASAEGIPPLERRAQRLNEAIMCPVCPGESIDQSQNALAVQMRGIAVEKLGQGWTEQQIKDFFVERYGPSVLMEPPRRGISLAVWVVPPIGVIAAGLALAATLRMMRRPTRRQAEPPSQEPGLTEEERARYFSRIEAALDDRGNEKPAEHKE